MKTDRKHELQKNELADVLGHEIDYLKPYFKTILGVIVAIAAVGFTIAFLSNQKKQKNTAAWGDFYNVMAEVFSGGGNQDPKALEQLAETHPGTEAALWAQLAAADQKLRQGSMQMFSDRKEAEASLESAQRLFETVSRDAGNDPLIRRRAKIGLAEALEAQNNPEDALPLYEEVVSEDRDDAIGKLAAERVAQLKRLSDNGWYAWFAKYEPIDPKKNPLEGTGPFGEGLNNLPGTSDLNKTPGLDAPGIIGDALKEEEMQDDDLPLQLDAPRKKKTSPTVPREDDEFKPDAVDPPGDTTPPEEEKPAEKPADPPAEEKTPE